MATLDDIIDVELGRMADRREQLLVDLELLSRQVSEVDAEIAAMTHVREIIIASSRTLGDPTHAEPEARP